MPSLIFMSGQISMCGIIAFSISLAITVLTESNDKYSIRHNYSFTFYHIWLLSGYLIVAIITIGWTKTEYNEMKELAQCSLFYTILLIIVFIIEAFINTQREKRFITSIKVGDLYEESNAEDKVSEFCDYLIFKRNVLWRVYHKDAFIHVYDLHNPRRKKIVYYSDLIKMKKVDNAWYRTSEYYNRIIKEVQARAATETYYSEEK